MLLRHDHNQNNVDISKLLIDIHMYILEEVLYIGFYVNQIESQIELFYFNGQIKSGIHTFDL